VHRFPGAPCGASRTRDDPWGRKRIHAPPARTAECHAPRPGRARGCRRNCSAILLCQDHIHPPWCGQVRDPKRDPKKISQYRCRAMAGPIDSSSGGRFSVIASSRRCFILSRKARSGIETRAAILLPRRMTSTGSLPKAARLIVSERLSRSSFVLIMNGILGGPRSSRCSAIHRLTAGLSLRLPHGQHGRRFSARRHTRKRCNVRQRGFARPSREDRATWLGRRSAFPRNDTRESAVTYVTAGLRDVVCATWFARRGSRDMAWPTIRFSATQHTRKRGNVRQRGFARRSGDMARATGFGFVSAACRAYLR
jgi:hypothetical protein